MQFPPEEALSEPLFRFQVVSQVLILEKGGYSRAKAVKMAAEAVYLTAGRELRKISKRSIYRWLKLYELGFSGLADAPRATTPDSVVLPKELRDFIKTQKTADPHASIPEIIRRARALAIITPDQAVSRTTAWRSLNRMGIDTSRRKASPKEEDCRRFAYPHRMQMCIVDGVHFRAGATRQKRVAFFYLDDATRLVLGVIVGTAESARLFLLGLHAVILRHGLMDAMFVDNGAGFIALDSLNVLRNLGILCIHGRPGYPQGRGKGERFNQTARQQVLRHLDKNPEVDPDCAALSLRLRHFLDRQYNRTPHESLANMTPGDRFHQDARPLRFCENEQALAKHFVLHYARRVAPDNVVCLRGTAFEVIRGYAGTRILLYRSLLDDQVCMLHQGRLLKLAPLDPALNARDRRARKSAAAPGDGPLPDSSAQIAFKREYRPVVDASGGVLPPTPNQK